MTPKRARFYFSFRSPYSWLAYHDLMTRHRDIAETLVWRPFWEPDQESTRLLADAGGRFSYVPMSREKSLYILADVRRLASARGLVFTWPVDRHPWWEPSHLGYLVAARENRGPAYIEAMYRARWLEGRDISAPETLKQVAIDSGLEPGPVLAAADDPDIRQEGLRSLLDIYRDGVFGVPFFVHGFEKFWGVDRLAEFAGAVRGGVPGEDGAGHNGAPAGMMHGAESPASDAGHAGGCG